jgi:hypothetical protein
VASPKRWKYQLADRSAPSSSKASCDPGVVAHIFGVLGGSIPVGEMFSAATV